MPTPKITPDQAAAVDAVLSQQQQYLRALSRRLDAIGVDCVDTLRQITDNQISGLGKLRERFALWAKGEAPDEMPAWRRIQKSR